MKIAHMFVAAAVALSSLGAASAAFAQDKTQENTNQEWVVAQNGRTTSGASMAQPASAAHVHRSECVGPAGFCTPYFGG